MKNHTLIVLTLLIAACSQPAEETASITHFYAPEAGTIVAADSFRIAEDSLNNFYYAVTITSTDSSNKGYYLLDAHWGVNEAQSDFIYPTLQEEIIPAIERDRSQPYTYILGFKYRNNDTFHDYAALTATKVSPLKSQIELKYIKSYFIDSVEAK